MTPSPIVFLVDVENTDLTVNRIGDLLDYDLAALLAGRRLAQISQEVTR